MCGGIEPDAEAPTMPFLATRTAADQERSLAAFLARKAAVDGLLARLRASGGRAASVRK